MNLRFPGRKRSSTKTSETFCTSMPRRPSSKQPFWSTWQACRLQMLRIRRTTSSVVRLRSDWRAIRFIDDPDEEMQSIALKQSWEAIKYIDEPSDSQQLLACRSAEAVSYLHACLSLSDDEEVSAVAKKSLLDALTRGTPSEMDSDYRRLFLDMANGEEILESLSNGATEPAFEPRDFNFTPNDLIKIKVVQRLGLRKYRAQAPGAWSTFPEFRRFLAGHKDGSLYGYSCLGEANDYEKGEFIKCLAGGSKSSNPLNDEETCERAIRQSDFSIIHAAFACVPFPSDAVCEAYLAILAVERGWSSISPLSLDTAADLIRSCPDSRSSLQVASAASRFNDELSDIWALEGLMTDVEDISDRLRVDRIIAEIANARDPRANEENPIRSIDLDDFKSF